MVVAAPNFSAPNEGILFEAPSTKLIINDQEIGTATLFITENNVVWGGGISPTGTSVSTISLMYPLISLHAIQREPSPALYMVLNYELKVPELSLQQQGSGDTGADDDEDEDDDAYCSEDHPITQLRFIPPDEGDLNAMFAAMTQGQSLHPDPQDDEEDPYMDGQEFEEVISDEEFEDAEESTSPEEAMARLRQMSIDAVNGVNHADNDADEDIEE